MLEWKIYNDVSCAFYLITLLVTLQEQPSLPSPRLVKILTCEFMNENLCNIKYEDLARSKSEALVNVYILLEQNIKSCNAQRRRQRKRPKKSVGLISQKKSLHVQHTFFVHSFAFALNDHNVKLPKTSLLHVLRRKCRTCCCSLFFTRPFSPWWPLGFLIFSPPLKIFHVVLPTNSSLSSALALCRSFSR